MSRTHSTWPYPSPHHAGIRHKEKYISGFKNFLYTKLIFFKFQKMLPTILNNPSGQPHPLSTSGFISWVAKLVRQDAWVFYVYPNAANTLQLM